MVGHQKKRTQETCLKFLSFLIALACSINLILGNKLGDMTSFSPLNENAESTASTSISLTNNQFCNSIKGALAPGPKHRTMIQVIVSNSGHFPFLHNVLLSMVRNGMPWKPLVLSIGAGVCPMLANVSELQGHVICIPYLDRLFHQLQRDDPESAEQIQPKMMPTKNNNTASESDMSGSDHNTRFSGIDNTYYGWGGVEYKFLINAKLYALRDVLECGADAFITDTDVAFRKDPRPYFEIDGPEGDIIAQNDTTTAYELSLNSGFMYWKRTPQNLDLIHDIITVPPFWHIDQARVNTRMHKRSTPHTLLDAYIFPNGHMYFDHFNKLNNMVVFHANWNDNYNKKVEMLQNVSLWFLNETAG